MDSIYFKLVIVVLLLAIPSYFLYRSKAKDAPKYRQLKTYSNITYDKQEYFESDFKSAALYLFTLGSHKSSMKSRSSYDGSYEQYSFIFNKVTELQERINLGIAKLEQNISLIIKELKASSRLVNKATTIKIAIEEVKNTEKIDKQVHMIDGLGFTKVARLKTWFPSFSIFTGIMAGLLAIMVIWFLLLALGGSGTTLISYVIVLAVMIIPTIAFSTFKSRSNAKKFEQQDKALIERIKTILDNSEKLENTIIQLNTNNRELETYLNQLASTNREVTAALYKNSAYIKAARKSKALFKKDAYSEEENALTGRINSVVDGLGREVAVSSLLG